jgi:hypothetical protein
VRTAPNQEMAANWRVSQWGGGGTAMVAVENAPRTTAARSPAWTRCVHAWPWVEESEGGKRRERGAGPTPFKAEAGEAGERWGSRVRHRVEERIGPQSGATPSH